MVLGMIKVGGGGGYELLEWEHLRRDFIVDNPIGILVFVGVQIDRERSGRAHRDAVVKVVKVIGMVGVVDGINGKFDS